MNSNSSNLDRKAIEDKQSTVQDLEQQQIMRTKQLKSLLD